MSAASKLLITGASGFVGRWVALEAAARGLPVRVAVRRTDTGFAAGTDLVRVAGLDAQTDWSEALRNIDVVVHCAARVHVREEVSHEALCEFRRVNVEGTVNLARRAALSGVRRMIFLSSVGVNGGCTFERPFTEDDKPAPESPYAISKYEAEIALQELSAMNGLQIMVLRPPLVYGPSAPGNWRRLVRWVRSGLPLPLGAIDNRRSLMGIDNLTDLILRCVSHPAAANRTLLVSDGEDISTPDLVRAIAQTLGRRVLLLPVPAPWLRLGARLVAKADLVDKLLGSLLVDSSRARSLLDWSPPVSLADGLGRAAAEGSCAPLAGCTRAAREV